ncbi:N-acetylmuramate 1-kinase [Methylomarinovum caldicuralii]|uniref:N-acetylmuramate 1-kinase n=1 Tax=Methylomarinovum caldicuralii TaxID=438856 RepID=A0AAU9CTK2_9GAMM|nr:N-acetylmuramate 1-kinase [Methylomarinovum caldicuralii]
MQALKIARILARSPAQTADARLEALLAWAPVAFTHWTQVAGDASRRRYFRLHGDGRRWIVMDAPPPESPQRFAAVAGLLGRAGVRVPQILAQDFERGFLLLEDFGDRTCLQALDAASVDGLYGAALATLLRLQTRLDPKTAALPGYDRALLRRELAIFPEWLLRRWLDLPLDTALWERACEVLVESALQQPRVVVHRDYHSRNLMVLDEGGLGVLDFQDAVVGPVTYDAVSLLRDCYVAWPPERVALWAEDYRRRLARAGLAVDAPTWRCWFDRMGIQRHLKAAGIFVRLWLRDGKPGYLKDIPRTLRYVAAACRGDAALAPLGDFVAATVLPQVEARL